MSSPHSRNSSEVEPIKVSDVLPIFIKDYLLDFSFYDVQKEVKHIFTADEYSLLISEKDEKKQIFLLFWILSSNEKYCSEFLDCTEIYYDWLSEKVRAECNRFSSKNSEWYFQAVLTLRSHFQKHSDYNIHRINYFLPLRQALKKLEPHNYVVISGELGVGKKWLAVDVCCEYTVMKAMDFQIFCIDVSKCDSREEDLRMLQHLRLLLGGTTIATSAGGGSSPWRQTCTDFDSVDNKILDLQQYLREKLKEDEYKNCLLILTDVRNVKTLKAFNLNCKILITTRNRKVVESGPSAFTKHIVIGEGLTKWEFFCLFEKFLKRDRSTFPRNATDIYYQSNGNPYLLSIIAQNLRQRKLNNWDEWIKNLQNSCITDNKFTTVVELSLKVLRSEQLQLYATFAIFPHSIAIPLKLLATLWNKTDHETEELVAKFDKYSMVTRHFLQEEGVPACSVPFIYISHLKKSCQHLIDGCSLHRKVVEFYKIEEILRTRTEVDLSPGNCDTYFYHCIGYHIYEAGYSELFSKLFLDFGFLGQKLRAVGFSNTISDLKRYREQIKNRDTDRGKLLVNLLEFLPNVEEMLFHSKDTCLLQYALMANGPVREEALKQASRFSDKIWFNEKGHFHQRRQMVPLPNKPKFVKLLVGDICLIGLDNNDMLLGDLSLEYNNGPVFLTSDNNDQSAAIIEVQLMLDDKFIVTLDQKGELKLWSIGDDCRRSSIRKRSSKQKVDPLNFDHCAQMRKRKCKQSIHENSVGQRGHIQTFHIEQCLPSDKNAIDLHVVFENGDISVYTWNCKREEFERNTYIPLLATKLPDIRFLYKILGKYYMLLNRSGSICFYNLRDSSKTPSSFKWPGDSSNLVCFEVYFLRTKTCIVFVFGQKVLHLSLSQQKFAFLDGKLETIYELSDEKSSITCAKLSRGGRYLVLGTKRGIIVFDMKTQSEILRSNVSQSIVCVDIYPLDDRIFKYIIVCGSKLTKILNIFALRDSENNSISWSHNVAMISNEASNNPQMEPFVWLLGDKLFDLTYSDKTAVLLVAADSKNRIHQLCTTDTKNWSISLPPESSHGITAITAYNSSSYSGYENGSIFNIAREIFENPLATDCAITFLQLVDEQILVAASESANMTTVRDAANDVEKRFKIDTRQCFKLLDKYLLLVNPNGCFLILDMSEDFQLLHEVTDVHHRDGTALAGCDLKNNFFFMATIHFKIYIYKFDFKDGQLEHKKHMKHENNETNDKVTCITAANNGMLLAVGLESGAVDVLKMEESNIEFLYHLLSHTSRIYDLKFSSQGDILASCSEQLCFWDVSYMLNNPFGLEKRPSRYSSRFRSSPSFDEEDVKEEQSGVVANTPFAASTINPWSNKRGPSDKPELLSCIKFVGNKAEKFFANDEFTQFHTIDDEGVYYHLCVLDMCNRRTPTAALMNGHGHAINHSDENIDDDVII